MKVFPLYRLDGYNESKNSEIIINLKAFRYIFAIAQIWIVVKRLLK